MTKKQALIFSAAFIREWIFLNVVIADLSNTRNTYRRMLFSVFKYPCLFFIPFVEIILGATIPEFNNLI